MESYSLLYSSTHRGTVFSGLHRLRAEGRMCDVVLETGGVSFPCHRALLASSSVYFWALFGDTAVERSAPSVSLPALTPEGLGIILDFLYSSWLSLSEETLPAVLEAARYLQVEAAVVICERFIIDRLNVTTCCCYANLAECHALQEVLKAANHTITMEMELLLRDNRKELLELNIQSLTAVLDADEVPGVKEVELFSLALEWLDVNAPISLLMSNMLLSRLRFGLVAPDDLRNLSHSHRAMATPLLRSQLTRALEYHRQGSAKPIRQNRQSSVRASPNHVLLVGGGPNPDWPERQVLAFNLRNRSISPLSSGVPQRLKNHCVCSVGGFLFVIGGNKVVSANGEEEKSITLTTSNQVWRYDPRFECWEEVKSMMERRAQFTCCVVEDVLYAIGGRSTHPDINTHTSMASVEFYDMDKGTWRRGCPMPCPLYGHASAALGRGLYVSGGIQGNQSSIQGGNQATQRETSREVFYWDLSISGQTWAKRAPMSIARFGHRMATVNGHIYALLGMYEPFCDIERYDAEADYWTRLRPLLSGSSRYGMVSTPSGTLLLFGGRKWSDGEEVTVRSVWEYDTERDRWREVCQLPRPLTGTECALLSLPV